MNEITEAHHREFIEKGFVIIEDFYDKETCERGIEEMHKVFKPWSEIKDNPPKDFLDKIVWPSSNLWINRFAISNDRLVNYAKKFLGTDDILLRSGTPFVRYPGCDTMAQCFHIDNGNNSLLPQSSDPSYGQISFWSHLEEVKPGQAPLLLVPHGKEPTHENAVSLTVPAGTLCLKNNYTWHSASPFTAKEGQRYIWGGAFGRADHHWEGFQHYTSCGTDPHFQELVRSLTPRQREMLRFPPVGHPYYTPETLKLLDEQYGGFDQNGEYRRAFQVSKKRAS